jgi:hypothetical protein
MVYNLYFRAQVSENITINEDGVVRIEIIESNEPIISG